MRVHSRRERGSQGCCAAPASPGPACPASGCCAGARRGRAGQAQAAGRALGDVSGRCEGWAGQGAGELALASPRGPWRGFPWSSWGALLTLRDPRDVTLCEADLRPA